MQNNGKYKIIQNSQTPRTEKIVNVKDFIETNRKDLKEFLCFSQSHFLAAGLSANQVSKNSQRLMWRVFAINDMVDFCNLNQVPGWTLIINPEITEYIGVKKIKYEGCKSWECSTIETERYEKIKVSYYTPDGARVENEIHSGFKAQVWQHEINHLNGTEENKLPKSFLERTACKINSTFFPLPSAKMLTS